MPIQTADLTWRVAGILRICPNTAAYSDRIPLRIQPNDAFGHRRLRGSVLGDLNHVHPFREGNGRTQLQYLKQLAARAGHAIDKTGPLPVFRPFGVPRNRWSRPQILQKIYSLSD